MNYIPLAEKLRPNKFSDILGNKDVIEIYQKMIEKQKFFSTILFGAPGNGKTTIANVFSEESNLVSFKFNASTDTKTYLADILNNTNYHEKILVIIDEIHRMKKDVQDYLLPFIENGKAVIIGLTSLNPYHTINPAIRSRVTILEIKNLEYSDLEILFNRCLDNLDVNLKFKKEVKDYLINSCLSDCRQLINIIEAISIIIDDKEDILINMNIVKKVLTKPNLSVDKNGDNYYNILSGLQKSIRGSDVDASLFYASKLILMEDIESLFRRLIVIGYEDIGLANPNINKKILDAYEAVKIVGIGEGRIIISNIVIEMALSPKSNSAYLAIDKAIKCAEYFNGKYPDNINNDLIKFNKNLYHYPHDFPNGLNSETYLPEKIKNINFYEPKDTSNYEEQLKKRYEYIKKIKNK